MHQRWLWFGYWMLLGLVCGIGMMVQPVPITGAIKTVKYTSRRALWDRKKQSTRSARKPARRTQLSLVNVFGDDNGQGNRSVPMVIDGAIAVASCRALPRQGRGIRHRLARRQRFSVRRDHRRKAHVLRHQKGTRAHMREPARER
jgi:hypothetical protein